MDDETVVAGVLVHGFSGQSPAFVRRLREEKGRLISRASMEKSVVALGMRWKEAAIIFEKEKKCILDKYVTDEQFKPDLLKTLQPEIQKGLSFVHDYKQINAQIAQNINVIIESRYVGADFEDKLRHASEAEKAIYHASKFLEEKLAVAKFLMHPDWLERPEGCARFRFHGLVTKYVRIYTPRFESKSIKVSMRGESWNEIVADPQAIAVIPHTLIDNAAKYSPRDGKIDIFTQDAQGGVNFEVSSFGPRISPEEEEKIFQPFYRGQEAIQVEEDGAGYGLYISQLVAGRHLGTEIKVRQQSQFVAGRGYWTTFCVRIPPKAIVARLTP